MLPSISHSLPKTSWLPSRPGGGRGNEKREVTVSVFKWGQTEERRGHLALGFPIIITPHLISSHFELWGELHKILTTLRRVWRLWCLWGRTQTDDGLKKYCHVVTWAKKKKQKQKGCGEPHSCRQRKGKSVQSLVSRVSPECKCAKGALWAISQQMTICLILFLLCICKPPPLASPSAFLPTVTFAWTVWMFYTIKFSNKPSCFSCAQSAPCAQRFMSTHGPIHL